MSAARVCPACGRANAPESNFCVNCGRALTPGGVPPSTPPGAPTTPPYWGAYPPHAYIPPPKRATVATILSGTFGVWTRNFPSFFLVYLVLGAILSLLGAALSFALLGTLEAGGFSPIPGTPTTPAANLVLIIVYIVAAAIVSAILTSVVTGGMTEFAVRRLRGEPMSVRRAIERGLEKFLSVLGANLLLTLIVIGLVTVPLLFLVSSTFGFTAPGGLISGGSLAALCGSLIAIIVGGVVALYLYVSMILYAPFIMMENARAVEGLSRSWRVTKGYWWSLFGSILVTGILVLIVGVAITVPAAPTGFPVVALVASALGTAIVGPWIVILAGVTYDQITRPVPTYAYGPAMPYQPAPPSPPPGP